MPSLRTKETAELYKQAIAEGALNGPCVLCAKKPLQEFELWKIVQNDFPYDLIAKTHHMIVPKRHATEKELTPEEWSEFSKIKDEYLHPNYEYLMEAAHKMKSVPAHFHWHLIVPKD